ncbi:hypothetical protein V6N12_036541 [Hibiscus sabdariffa]|uniref:Uncharacterized protein n=1 Tax=Hibiscus sabdariffa TaxID=183260 RepID=A0ABR2EQW4_9ROSI
MQEKISDSDFSVQKKQDIPIYKGKESVKEGELGCHEKENQKVYVPRKIQGHVVDEQLWELKRCFVGVMATVSGFRVVAELMETEPGCCYAATLLTKRELVII